LELSFSYVADFTYDNMFIGIQLSALANWHFIPRQVWRQTYGRHLEKFLLKFASPVDGRCHDAIAWSP
jgi:Flp pilus assembly protein TadB